MNDFLQRGWRFFSFDPKLADWVTGALASARNAVAAPENARWLRCGGTWFVGVDALASGPDGSVGGGPALCGAAMQFIHTDLDLPDIPLHRAQVSVCYPGYPRPSPSESDAAFRFRRDRDAAHLDGLLAEGPGRRRRLREPHAFILGIPLTRADPDAAPFVVWEGSHEIIRDAFTNLFEDLDPQDWSGIDVTEGYQAARRTVFDTCERVEVAAKPGEAYLVHRLAIHGVAPWRETARAGPDGRMIAYFRPEAGTVEKWLFAP